MVLTTGRGPNHRLDLRYTAAVTGDIQNLERRVQA